MRPRARWRSRAGYARAGSPATGRRTTYRRGTAAARAGAAAPRSSRVPARARAALRQRRAGGPDQVLDAILVAAAQRLQQATVDQAEECFLARLAGSEALTEARQPRDRRTVLGTER